MSNKKQITPYFSEFQAFFRGRPNIPQNELKKRAISELKSSDLCGLSRLLSNFIPTSIFKSNLGKDFSRNRIYNLEVTFIGFLNQVLLNTSSCSVIVKKIQSWRVSKRKKVQSSATGGYVKAKMKLHITFLKDVFNHTVKKLTARETSDHMWLNRIVKVVDGTGISMPDTKKNQNAYPQNGAMKKGCGFPQLNMTAIFSLGTGALLGYEIGNKHKSENRLWIKLWKTLNPYDIVLGDKGFCSYANIASLLMKKVDSVLRFKGKLNGKRLTRIKNLGRNDCLYKIAKPNNPSKLFTKLQWAKIPDEITVRIVKVPVIRKGFRSKEFVIVSTLLDHTLYSPEKLGELYLKRWSIELYFKDIKTTMGMEILKSKTPTQVKKEICMFAIGYNLIRNIILDSSSQTGTDISKISFSGTIQQLDQWLHLFISPDLTLKDYRNLLYQFHTAIAQKLIPNRPGRNEPRAKKRRAKNYNLMNKPRHKMIITNHRNNISKKNAFYCLK